MTPTLALRVTATDASTIYAGNCAWCDDRTPAATISKIAIPTGKHGIYVLRLCSDCKRCFKDQVSVL